MPRWIGGAPKDGGGPDKELVKVIKGLKLGSRVRLEWSFDERPRAVKIDLVSSPAEQGTAQKNEKTDAVKKGTVSGMLTSKAENWIEIKADGEEKARRYFFHQGGTKELREAIQATPVGSRVRIDWLFIERPRVMKLDLMKKAD
jgi:hypothetical protein